MDRDQYTFEELAKLLSGLPSRHKQKIVAIDGVGGVGKSTFAQELQKTLPGSTVIHADDFYKIESERVTGNTFEINPNFDWDRMDREVFTPLHFGQPISYHVYDWHKDEIGAKVPVPADVVIILEGGYVTQNRFSENYDFKIWIDAPDTARLTRILERDGQHMLQQWENEWMPIERNYIDKEKPNLRADLIVNGTDSDFKTGYYKIFKS